MNRIKSHYPDPILGFLEISTNRLLFPRYFEICSKSLKLVMEAIDELAQLSESMRQASALLADEDIDETTSSSSSSRRSSTFLNVVALGNVVSSLDRLDLFVF